MIAEFERRLREMSEPMVQVSYAAMVLAATDASTDRSFAWFDDRAQMALKELERRGSIPRPLPEHDPITPARGPRQSKGPAWNRALTQEQAEQIRQQSKNGVAVSQLARTYGVAEPPIRRIIANKTYQTAEEAV